MKQKNFKRLIVSLLCGVTVMAQTKVNLREQAREVDFSGAVSTRPLKSGTVLPATCAVGDMYFKTNSAAGSNINVCAATNTWIVASGNSIPSASGQDGRALVGVAGSAAWSDLSGDVTGAANALRVQKLQNRTVASTAPSSGQSLVWNGTLQQWEPQTVSGGGGGGGSMTIQNDGSVVGTRSNLNIVPGFGVLNLLSDNGTAVVLQQAVDTAVVQSKASAQSGATQACFSSGASVTAYACGLTPALTAYTTGMVVNWRPDVSGVGGGVTLNIDTLGSRPVKLADGVTNPGVGDLAANQMRPIWYDGTNFRLMSSSGGGGGGGGTTMKESRYFPVGSKDQFGNPLPAVFSKNNQLSFFDYGTNALTMVQAVLNDNSAEAFQIVTDVPAGLSNLDVTVDTVQADGSSGQFRLNISTGCIAHGESLTGLSYNTASNVTGTYGAVNALVRVIATGVNISGCAEGEILRLQVARDATDAVTSDVLVLGVRMAMTRSVN